jgi:DNA-binding XRE family transcriptional regulator
LPRLKPPHKKPKELALPHRHPNGISTFLSQFYEILKKNCLFLSLNQHLKMNRIKEVLEEKGIKQIWLAEKLGKSYNMVNAYAQNRQQPRLEVLFKIAEILNISVKDLIIDDNN